MNYYCCEKLRLNAVREHPTLNGIEYLDVVDNPSDANDVRQTTLIVHFVKELTPLSLSKQNVRIEGGERVRNIKVVDINVGGIGSPPSPPSSPIDGDVMKQLIVKVSEAGDFSRYTLRIVEDNKDNDPPPGFDPILSSIEFSFKVLCAKEFDCKPVHECESEVSVPPEINYLAKDYASFRQLMLDRMAVLVPQWKERNPADLGVALVELLAYAGDYLSYRQDAIATEAYLGTARKRVSIRRHARLVDYLMHEGCNARAWVHVDVAPEVHGAWLRHKSGKQIATQLLTNTGMALPEAFKFDNLHYRQAIDNGALVFEPMHDVALYHSHNRISFYTWGDEECCLSKGATAATLKGDLSSLKRGDILIIKEVRGPQTGAAPDADPSRRHAVRLTDIEVTHDPLFESLSSPLSSPPSSPPVPAMPVTRIKWHPLDALPFPFCLSARNGTAYYEDVSIALGNNVLVDHGRTTIDTLESSLSPDKASDAVIVTRRDETSFCDHTPPEPQYARYRPVLKYVPLTHAARYTGGEFNKAGDPKYSAGEMSQWAMRDTDPSIELFESESGEKWTPVNDLMSSAGEAKEFVVETESDGVAQLRFGDDKLGMHPLPGTKFLATYRLGNGTVGNIGREAIAHLVSDDPDLVNSPRRVLSVTNPMAAAGGVDPESPELVKQKAPSAFRIQERAVTRDDYAEVTRRVSSSIQRAACTFRWTGSWRTAFITIDRLNGAAVDEKFELDVRERVEQYRMAGQDIEVNGPRYVSLEIEMAICVKSNYFASDVKASLLKVFSSRRLADGRPGVFHPDNFTFGQTVYLSPFYAAAQAVAGVASVQITTFKRQGDSDNSAVDTGRLLLSKLEIARLDNDPNFADHGILSLVVKGGK